MTPEPPLTDGRQVVEGQVVEGQTVELSGAPSQGQAVVHEVPSMDGMLHNGLLAGVHFGKQVLGVVGTP